MTTPTTTTANRNDEKRAAAIVLAAVKRRNDDPQLADDATYRSAIDSLARQGDVGPVLRELAEGLAGYLQSIIDAGGTVDDVAALLRSSVGTTTDEVV